MAVRAVQPDLGDLRVSHPFRLTLRHRPLAPHEMIAVSRTFDFRGVGGGRLAVDVEGVQAEQTVLRVTPNRPMTYEEIEEEATAILEELGPHAYGEAPTLERLDWLMAPQERPERTAPDSTDAMAIR